MRIGIIQNRFTQTPTITQSKNEIAYNPNFTSRLQVADVLIKSTPEVKKITSSKELMRILTNPQDTLGQALTTSARVFKNTIAKLDATVPRNESLVIKNINLQVTGKATVKSLRKGYYLNEIIIENSVLDAPRIFLESGELEAKNSTVKIKGVLNGVSADKGSTIHCNNEHPINARTTGGTITCGNVNNANVSYGGGTINCRNAAYNVSANGANGAGIVNCGHVEGAVEAFNGGIVNHSGRINGTKKSDKKSTIKFVPNDSTYISTDDWKKMIFSASETAGKK